MPFGSFVRQLGEGADSELLDRFIAGEDQSAFAALVGRYTPTVLGTCRRVLGHTQDAEDAAQAVFLLLARNAARVRRPSALGAWLHGVAVRVARKARRRRRRVQPLAGSSPPAAPPAPSWEDARRVIDEAVAALPEPLRAPLVLCYLEGLTRDEAAARLGWPLATLRGRLERGREKLRARLARRGFALAVGLLPVLLETPVAAAPNWSAHAAAVATGTAPPTPAVAALASGGFSVFRPLVCFASLALAGAATAGWYLTAPPEPIAPPASKPVARALTPDPQAGLPEKSLEGAWQSTAAGDGAVRTETLRFVDGKHLVWQVHLRSPGVDTNATLRGRYELKNGTLTYQVTDRWAGEESVRVRPEDAQRKYQLTWAKDRTAFELKNADTGAVRKFRALKDKETIAPVPDALKAIERKIQKEPKYASEPRYLLLAFGPEAKFLVWAVSDGTTLYVDRNGNGDLTDDGEKFARPTRDHTSGTRRALTFTGIEVTEPGGTTHKIEVLTVLYLETGSVAADVLAQAKGRPLQRALGDLWWADAARTAQVLHFGGAEVVCRPWVSGRSLLNAAAPAEFTVQVGTPGIGLGSFTAFSNDQVPKGTGPVAEIEFDPLVGGAKPITVTVNLTDRDHGDKFFARVTVPDGVKTGVEAAKVKLSFPNCPWGPVGASTHRVDVKPK
ncbi:RNA polymerase sigma factor [Gemmata sp. JC717]|uniref:RNA polymerase sigma factor n=1 Tax=Gemmata algarum TaxID=2975278 RepID=UPI0021BB3D68|nr:RNA polymerase sigma factor [Gemmata algarum]MDY3556806.1 RNA polymerase sigma factor [Gemmata algarum]